MSAKEPDQDDAPRGYVPMRDVYKQLGIACPSPDPQPAPPKRAASSAPAATPPTNAKRLGWRLLIYPLLIILALNVIIAMVDKSGTAPSRASPPASEGAREAQWIEMGKSSVRDRLKDPDSAEFRHVFFHRGADNIPVACGQVNSKNSFGAYAGFERFVFAGSARNTYLTSDVQGGEQAFASVWDRFCVK